MESSKLENYTLVWFSGDSCFLDELKKDFLHYYWVSDLESLIEKLPTIQHPVVLIDMERFKHEALELSSKLRLIFSHLPIIFYTHEVSTQLIRCIEKNKKCDFYLSPYHPNLLRKRIHSLFINNFESAATQNVSESPISKEDFQPVELAFMAFYDELTGLPNRKLFFSRLESSLIQARSLNENIAIMYIDLDGFKTINDKYTHTVGDWILKQVALRLRNCLKKYDTIARMGGDEFSVILSHFKDKETLESIIHRVLYSLSAPYVYEGMRLKLSASIGVSLFPDHSFEAHKLVHYSDSAMYEAKMKGKNSYKIFENNDLYIFKKNKAYA